MRKLNLILIIILFSLNLSCLTKKSNEKTNNNLETNKNIETKDKIINKSIVIAVPEMESPNFSEDYQFSSTKKIEENLNKKIIAKLKNFSGEIKKIDLARISNWAKPETEKFIFQENFLDDSKIESFFENENKLVVNIKSVNLPTHNPLVTRFLFIIVSFNKNTENIEKIFVTIQGYVEE